MIPIYNPRVITTSAKEALDSNWISSQGPFLEKAKTKLADILNVPYVILMNNGTSATHMLLKGLKYIYPEIKTIYAPNNVFVAVWNTILYEYPESSMKILEMDPLTLNMKTDEAYIKSLEQNSAIMIVHNVGNIINVPRLKRIRPDIIFIEDNCEGLFGKYEGVYSGTSTSTLCSSVSFFANKTITCGEGGAFFTHDKSLYEYIYNSIHHGASSEKYIYNVLGYNCRMTNIQAALLYDQITELESIRKDKHLIFETYKTLLKNHVTLPKSEENTKESEWMFVCGISADYKQLEQYMKENGIDIRPFFYDIKKHKHLSHIVSTNMVLVDTFFMLPSSPDLKREEIEKICNCLINYTIFHK